ncbi:hypothetical protein ALP44_101975 [Pseudomonas syringae pv. theae]|uniref:Uncharacterized protein n=1 Tax=Pseudomonas syringae pv. theae TaxID=103985 RepID=A0A3M5NII2_PSESX|nr:hypothetical protein ALP44_101975 [Pseudomonas syringae pv. theae]
MSFRPLSGLKALGKNVVLNSIDLLLNSLREADQPPLKIK